MQEEVEETQEEFFIRILEEAEVNAVAFSARSSSLWKKTEQAWAGNDVPPLTSEELYNQYDAMPLGYMLSVILTRLKTHEETMHAPIL